MEKLIDSVVRKVAFMFVLLSSSVFGQQVNTDTIYFKYNESIYKEIAKDTMKKMYFYQKNLLESNGIFSDDAIAKKIKWDDLSILVIPKFRLIRDATRLYTCNSDIEEFIQFEERYKYMSAIIVSNNIFQSMVSIPHPYFEMEKINNPDIGLEVDKSRYENGIIKMFITNTEYLLEVKEVMDKNKNNFFFGIYGLWDVVLEIDKETGLMYANRIDYGKVIRLPVNEYLNLYEGEVKIRELARGYYEDIDGTGTLIPIPCKDSKKTHDKKIIKVIR